MGSAYNRVIETRKELTKQLLAEMEQGELPWMKGWKTTGTRPYNPVTKAVYKGNNRLRLMLASHFGQFQDNRWVTFNQAKDKGWKIKSGEKGTLCEKWIFEEKKVIEDPVTGEKETVYEELEHPKVNYFILFNADQVDGIPEKEKKEPLSRDEQLALADQFVKSSVCSVIEGANETEAYYSPARDEIHLPARDYFYSAGEFLGIAIHEMGHSTGHPSRLARDISGGFGSTLVLVYKCRQKKLNSLYYKKKEQRRCSTWRKIKNRILRNSSNRSSISTMPEVPHILNWNMNMA